MRGEAVVLKRTDIDSLAPKVRHFVRHIGGRAVRSLVPVLTRMTSLQKLQG
jgi:hypothetical protein